MKYKYRLLYSFLLLFAIGRASAQETHDGHPVKAHQVLFRLSSSSTSAVLQRLSQGVDADDVRALNGNLNLYVLHSRSVDVAALLNILRSEPAIVYVEPDYIVKALGAPNDSLFSQQWALLNTTNPGADIGATGAWNISTGGTANVAGVVDTGIDYSHPDLSANVWSAPAPFTVALSWGSLTCPAGSHGYNSIARSCDPKDDHGHGTHVSGTIGAIGNNALGVAGVNWVARIMALKFLDSTGMGSTSDAVDAIEFALQAKSIFGAAANVRVLSNSWGGAGFSQALLDEINRANSADVLFVAAAGNSSQNNDVTPTYPAAFTAPNMVTVAATTNTDGIASFSNFGHNTVHLGAPGVNIISTLPNGSYGSLSGTSMATPHVSGAALLLLSACTLNTAALKNTLLANVDPVASLSGITVTGGRLNVNKAIHSCANVPVSPGTASFVKTDMTTAGTWKSVYGADGYNIVNDTANYPAYVTATASGNANFTWVASTTDARGLQKPASTTDRIAACWYTSGSLAIDLRFNDTSTHQVALYLLDWDNYTGGRSERVDILDANNAVLDSRTVSGFANGEYLVWNMSGHVTLRITNLNGNANAVMSGLLFGSGGSGPPSSGTASFVKTDMTTAGTWKSVYGADGYNIVNDTANYPAYVTATASGNATFTWVASTTDARGLQKAASTTDRIASCWYTSGSLAIDLRFNDSSIHQVALYLLDWDNYTGGRLERVDIFDANNAVLDSRTVSGFANGEYLVWNMSGHVTLRITNLNGNANAVMSGLLFGSGGSGPPSSGTASFVKTDMTTAGTWKSVYGADGYNIVNDTANYPAYVTATASGNANFTWVASTTDARGLQKPASTTDRIAACWYTSGSLAIDLRFNDTSTHQVALYLLDWDNYTGGRSERVDILDANNALLDSRTVSGFANGEYLVWNMSGHVTVRITNLNGNANAVLIGILFR